MRRWLLVIVGVVLGGFNTVPSIGLAAGPPATLAAWTGTPQSAAVNTNFGVAMVAVVRDSATNGVQGVTVTFTAPGAGASGTFAGLTTANVVTDNNGLAIAPTIRANGIGGSYTVTASVTGLAITASFSLTNTGGGGGGTPVPPVAPSNLRIVAPPTQGPQSLSIVSGTPQSVVVNTSFSTLQALLRDSGGSPISGALVTFATPSSGATAFFGGTTTATATTNASGVASAPMLTANGTTGNYLATASAPGAAAPVSFSLTNIPSGGGGGGGGWTNVTPGGVNLTSDLDCGNYGTLSVVADPLRPSNLYTQFNCQGIWKSVDYGLTWTGPINTGSGGAGARGAGGIAIAPGPAGQPPILYSAGIRGTGNGFWRSLDGGVSWTNYNIAPTPGRQDYYPPVVDPYNVNHLLLVGHEMNVIVQSFNGGQTWTSVPMAGGMNQSGGTGFLFFIDTGNAATTANTWIWSAQVTTGVVGTWRTTNGGTSWTKVDNNEHGHGTMQIYQPGNGVVFMSGFYSALGWGVLRSADYGQTWQHVGAVTSSALVYGTPNRVYTAYSWACGHCTVDPQFQSAPSPGITGWTSASPPPGMAIGPAQAAVVFNGSRYVIVTANWLAGLWRYVE